MPEAAPFPVSAAGRTRFVLARRGARPAHDPRRHQGVLVEDERDAGGRLVATATIFLTGRECPWHCTMCDLWRHTLAEDTPSGAIPAQVASACRVLAGRPHPIEAVKLYNAGSFFDPRAVPDADYEAVAEALAGFGHVIVESHPALIGRRVDRWIAALARHGGASLEVAMGLETVHPGALDRLNKGFDLERFARAARGLADRGVALRVFLLIAPPFVPAAEQDGWLLRSIEAAFDLGAAVVSMVPTRPGNGALEALAADGSFRAPALSDIERSAALALASGPRGRVFTDTWDLERFSSCDRGCLDPRRRRLAAMNLEQRVLPPCVCEACGGSPA
jgi:radical SAM enzyme (TIGR01210 family)